LPGRANYYIGNNPQRWLSNLPTYASVLAENVYPGIDVRYYGNPGGLEYDWVLRPGANPALLRWSITGARHLQVDGRGDLIVAAAGMSLRQASPVVYQTVGNERRPVLARYVRLAGGHFGLRLGQYNRRLPLIVDPSLAYSLYLGGSGNDSGNAVAIDQNGHIVVVGDTSSTNFPRVNPFQASLGGAGFSDAFVSEFNATGTALIYSTYLGGSCADSALAVALDGGGNAYVTGFTQSPDFPVMNALQPTFGGGFSNAFVAKFNVFGGLVYSTFLGGNNSDSGNAIAVDSGGSAYVAGYTRSANFPTALPLQPTLRGYQNAFVSKLTTNGRGLIYSTFLGGNGEDAAQGIALDRVNDVYLTGYTSSRNFPLMRPLFSTPPLEERTAFVTEINPLGTSLLFSTYYGGRSSDTGYGIKIDAQNNIVFGGSTYSRDFPTVNAAQKTFAGSRDGFIAKLTAGGGGIVYSTFLGGSNSISYAGFGSQGVAAVALDLLGNAYVTGSTDATNFPLLGAFQPVYGGGFDDAFVTKLSPSGAFSYSSYLGGSNIDYGYGIAVDSAGNAYVTGSTDSANFPGTSIRQSSNHGGYDAFLTKVFPQVAPPVNGFFTNYTGIYNVAAGPGGCPPTCLVSGIGQGQTIAGPTSFQFQYTALYSGAACAPVQGSFHLIGADGSQLSANMTGQTCFNPANQAVHTEQGTFTVTGATGKFASLAAAGMYSGTRACNPSTCAVNDTNHQFSLTLAP
jgi:hypothetical protein